MRQFLQNVEEKIYNLEIYFWPKHMREQVHFNVKQVSTHPHTHTNKNKKTHTKKQKTHLLEDVLYQQWRKIKT